MYCKYSKYIVKNVWEQYLDCSLTRCRCTKQKFCNKRNKVVQTDDWQQCPKLVREEGLNAKKITKEEG